MTNIDYNFLYSQGRLASWYLYDYQFELMSMLKAHLDVVTICHRRFGKDTTVLTYASEMATTHKDYLIRYGAPTLKQAYEITDFVLSQIYKKDMKSKPVFKDKGGYWDYGNGSKMTLFGGADREQIEKGRGVQADLIILSEFGFFKYRPTELLKEILSPQLVTTKGQKVIVSTMPRDLTHEYVVQLNNAAADNRRFYWDIHDSIRVGAITQEQHEKIIKDCGGTDTDSYQREYECKLIPLTKSLVIPEAQDDSLYIGICNRPDHFNSYISMDLGFVDYTAALFAYYNFDTAKLVIEKELMLNYKSTREIVEGCKEIEKELNYKKPRRLADNDRQQLYDMSSEYGYSVTPITKRSSQANTPFRDSVLNGLRIALVQGKVLVSPECTNLITQLKYGIWNEKRTDFERTETMGHLDMLMALAYLVDNIDWTTNPYPRIPEGVRIETHHISKELLKPKNNLTKLIKRR